MKRTYTISGERLLHHNIRLADSTDKLVKEMKKVTSIRGQNRTEADLEKLQQLEWFGGLYLNEESRPIIPAKLIDACLINGAKRTRGKASKTNTIKTSVRCVGDNLLIYSGPKTAEELWKDDRFRFRTGARIGKDIIFRTRPVFNDWKLNFTLEYDPASINAEDLDRTVQDAGQYCGLGDWRPQNGTFKVIDIK